MKPDQLDPEPETRFVLPRPLARRLAAWARAHGCTDAGALNLLLQEALDRDARKDAPS